MGNEIIAENADKTLSAAAILSSGELLPVNSQEFIRCAVESAPQDIRDILESSLKRKNSFSLLTAAVVLLTFAFCIYMIFQLLPRLDADKFAISPDTAGLTQEDNVEKFRKIQEAYENKRYSECCKISQPIVEKILSSGGNIQKNRLLFYYFFDSAIKTFRLDSLQYRRAAELLDSLKTKDRDTPQWWIFYYSFILGPELDAADRKNGQSLKKFESEEKHFRTLDNIIPETMQKQYDYLQAKLYLQLWLLRAPYCSWDMTDDCKDCLNAREKACEIIWAKNYDNTVEFIKLRKFVLETMLEKCGVFSGYIFLGESKFAEAKLEQELESVKKILSNLQEQRR